MDPVILMQLLIAFVGMSLVGILVYGLNRPEPKEKK